MCCIGKGRYWDDAPISRYIQLDYSNLYTMAFNLSSAFHQYPFEIIVSIIVVLLSFRILPLLYCITAFVIASRPVSPSRLSNHAKGKHIVISGASAGLGLATAIALAKAGAKLTLIARGADKDAKGKSRLDHAVEECWNVTSKRDGDDANADDDLRQQAKQVGSIACDVSDFTRLVESLALAVAQRGSVDWIIANAGAAVPGFAMDQLPTDHGTKSQLDFMLNVNAKGPAHLVQAVLANASKAANDTSRKISGIPLQAKVPERIVLVGSQICCVGFIGYTAYAARYIRHLLDQLMHSRYAH